MSQDKRLTNRLLGYWDRIRRDLPMPPWELFNARAIEDIWEHCCLWLVDIPGGEYNQYTYEYVGHGLKDVLGTGLTGLVFSSHLQRFPGARIVQRIDEIVKCAEPIHDEGMFVNEKDKIVKFRSCMVPFGKKGRVTHVVMGLSWKAS